MDSIDTAPASRKTQFFYAVRDPCQEGHLAMGREVFETVVSPHPAVLDPAW